MRMVLAICFFLTTLISTPIQGNQHIILGDYRSVHEVRGSIKDPSEFEVQGVTVELFDHPEVLRMDFARRQKAPPQRKIAETKSDAKGKFVLLKIPPGKYELRFTTPGFNLLSVFVKVVRSSKKITEDKLEFHLQLGT